MSEPKVCGTLKSITINSVTIWKLVIPDRIVKMSNFVQVSSLMSQQQPLNVFLCKIHQIRTAAKKTRW